MAASRASGVCRTIAFAGSWLILSLHLEANLGAEVISPDSTPTSTIEGKGVHRMTMFFTSGGSLPPNWTGSQPDTFPGDNGAFKAELITVQHAYAASFDIDLAPKIPAGIRPNYSADSFDGPQWFLDVDHPLRGVQEDVNNTNGFRVEDHNYEIAGKEDWPLGYDFGFDKTGSEYFHQSTEAPIFPELNYDPVDYNDRPQPSAQSQAEFAALSRFKMTCNVGPQMLTGWPASDNIVQVNSGDVPGQVPEEMVVAQNRFGLRLVTGPLAAFWNEELASCQNGAPIVLIAIQADLTSIILKWANGGCTYILERSGDLTQWESLSDTFGTQANESEIKYPINLAASGNIGFYRVRVH